MYDPTFQRFSSAYDQVELRVEPGDVSTPLISQPFIEDLRYWTANLDDFNPASPVFVRTPEMDGHLRAECTRDVPVETIRLPEPVLRELGIHQAPTNTRFWVARPGHAEQLERFYV